LVVVDAGRTAIGAKADDADPASRKDKLDIDFLTETVEPVRINATGSCTCCPVGPLATIVKVELELVLLLVLEG
jgi:hypothetical protein